MGMCIIPFLVVIHQIHIEHVTVFEPEYDAPTPADADAPVPFPIAFQRLQAISGKVKVHRMERRVEMGQHIGNALESPGPCWRPRPETDAARLGDGTSVSLTYCTVYRDGCQCDARGHRDVR